MSSIEFFTSALKHAGMRLTPQRIAICELLCESNAHPTANAIFDQTRTQFPSISLMTVYNTLNALVNLGVVNQLGSVGDDNVHYDGNIAPHVNLACIACHKIVDITSPHIDNLAHEVSTTSGYKLLGVRMMYYGLCPDCTKESRNLLINSAIK